MEFLMALNELRYESPKTTKLAIELLAREGEVPIIFAGGTDLIVQMQDEVIEPTLLVDIKKIDETREIVISHEQIRIGAAVTGVELGENKELKIMWPGIVEAVELIGSHQIQGRATIGGNLCNASPAADSVPALISACAKVEIAGRNGLREVSVEDFLLGPGKTLLARGEFVTAIVLSKPLKGSGDAYLRFIPRTEMDIAVVGAGMSVVLDAEGNCERARLALGAVSPTAILVEEASKILIGQKLNLQILDELGKAAEEVSVPIDDKRGTKEFRKKVAGVMARRVAQIAWQRAEKNL